MIEPFINYFFVVVSFSYSSLGGFSSLSCRLLMTRIVHVLPFDLHFLFLLLFFKFYYFLLYRMFPVIYFLPPEGYRNPLLNVKSHRVYKFHSQFCEVRQYPHVELGIQMSVSLVSEFWKPLCLL